jgi:hypothetical protein
VLDVAQSAQGLNSSAHTKTLQPTQESFTKDMGLTKRGWRELKRLLKGYTNGQEPTIHERGGEVPFIGIWKTSCWGYQSRLIHHTGQIGRVTQNWLRALSEENSLN